VTYVRFGMPSLFTATVPGGPRAEVAMVYDLGVALASVVVVSSPQKSAAKPKVGDVQGSPHRFLAARDNHFEDDAPFTFTRLKEEDTGMEIGLGRLRELQSSM
jgi:hypothetical protein